MRALRRNGASTTPYRARGLSTCQQREWERQLGLPRPDHALGIGCGGHAGQIGRKLVVLEPILTAEHPDAVLVSGDTNSTLAGSLAAAKLGIPVAHVEAALRSHDRHMPEELNRLVADHLSTWHFAPTAGAAANLPNEGR